MEASTMRPRSTPSVVVVGELFNDEIFSGFQMLPKLGEEAFARRFAREAGGGAAITACGLAKLGVNVAVVGVLGASDGGWIIDRLQSFGVDCSAVEYDPYEPTGVTVSVSTSEDRAFFTYYGANQLLPRTLPRVRMLELAKRARHVHFACSLVAERDIPLIRALRRRRCRTSVDVQSHVSWLTRPENLKILRECDIFFPNEREAEWMIGLSGAEKILPRMRDAGVRGVGLKMGGKGAALLWRRREFLADAFPVEPIDTTGAGDCFNAGFIYAWLRDDPPLECLETGNICGALSTRALGGISAFPTLAELEAAKSKSQSTV